MILLVTAPHGDCVRYGCGRLVQPRHHPKVELTARSGIPWAADNDCFQGLDEVAFRKMLAKIGGLPGCLFVTVPDVVADHAATLALWPEWSLVIRRLSLPPAFVLQDGCPAGWFPPDAAAVFVGGSTEYKLGPDAAASVAAARERGLWAHMGRVNGEGRMRLAASIGCGSVDGTGWAKFKRDRLARGVRAARRAPLQQMRIEGI